MARHADRNRPRTQPSQRQLQAGEAIRHALSDVLARGNIRDPALAGVSITVTEVRLSPDMRQATVFVMPLGGKNTESVLDGLARAAPFLAGSVAPSVRTKFTPRLSFALDESFDHADHVEALLRRARRSSAVDGDQDQPHLESESHDGR